MYVLAINYSDCMEGLFCLPDYAPNRLQPGDPDVLKGLKHYLVDWLFKDHTLLERHGNRGFFVKVTR